MILIIKIIIEVDESESEWEEVGISCVYFKEWEWVGRSGKEWERVRRIGMGWFTHEKNRALVSISVIHGEHYCHALYFYHKYKFYVSVAIENYKTTKDR